jgi:hypothetical protein
MSDFISRKKALDGLKYEMKYGAEIDRCGLDTAYDIIESIPIAETERKWIPVTERLPKKENKSYWICTDTKHQCECRWTNNIYGIGKSNNWGWSIFDIPQYTRVIAWMHLPEPYRGE